MIWHDDAACLDDPRNWVMEAVYREYPSAIADLFATCAGCPVRRRCLDQALTTTDITVVGVWGGTTWVERTQSLNAKRRWLRATRAVAGVDLEVARLSFAEDLTLRLEAVEELMSSFPDRWWGYRSAAGIPTCAVCGQASMLDEPCGTHRLRLVTSVPDDGEYRHIVRGRPTRNVQDQTAWQLDEPLTVAA